MHPVLHNMRRHRWWIVAALACAAGAVVAPSVSKYRRAQAVKDTAAAQGAWAEVEFAGPAWLGEALDRIPSVRRLLQSRVRGMRYVEQRQGQTQPAELSYLRSAPDVEYLDLVFAPEITDADLASIGTLTRLKHLDIRGPTITNTGVRHLARLVQLEALFLEDTRITDDELDILADMPRLQMLSLEGSRSFTGAGLIHVPRECRLQTLSVSRTAFRQGLEHVDLTSMKTVWAYSTPLADAGIAPLCNAFFLQQLRLDNTRITDEGIAPIAGLYRLSILSLSNTQITDDGIAQLSGLPNLEGLFVTETAVTQSVAKLLAAKLPRVSIAYGPDREQPQWAYGADVPSNERLN